MFGHFKICSTYSKEFIPQKKLANCQNFRSVRKPEIQISIYKGKRM